MNATSQPIKLTDEEQQAFHWAMKQDFQSVAARYAKVLAKALQRAGADFAHTDACAKEANQ